MVHFFEEHLPIIPALYSLKGNGGLINPDVSLPKREENGIGIPF